MLGTNFCTGVVTEKTFGATLLSNADQPGTDPEDGNAVIPLTVPWVPMSFTSPKALVAAVERIQEINAVGVSSIDVDAVPMRRLRELARWGMTAKAPALRRHLPARRTATLLATAINLEGKAIDDALELFDLVMVTDLVAKARRHAKNETLKRYPKVTRDAATCAAAINVILNSANWDADTTVATLFAAIDEVVPRQDLVAAIENIASVTPPASARAGGEWRAGIIDRYATVRRFLPIMCDTIGFGATAGAEPILQALLSLPELMLIRPTKHVPSGYLAMDLVDADVVPNGWWRSLVFPNDRPDGTVDRAAYVFCVLEQFHQRLGRRDIFATASSRWADPRVHLLSGPAWSSAKAQVLNALELPEEPDELLAGHTELLHETLTYAATTAIVDEEGRLHSSAVDAIPDPPGLIDLRARSEAMLPIVDIGEAILEVMSWHPEFAEASTSVSGTDTRLGDLDVTIAAALTAHALNVGFSPIIAPSNPALTRNRLSHVDQNYLRGATYSAANAPIVAAQSEIDLAQLWGGGLVAAVDGVRFVVPVRSIHKRPNPKYFGRRRGATMLNLVNDHAVGIASMVVSGTPRDSLHVIDLIYRQDAGPRPEVIITDTGSYSDIVFGLLQLLGFDYRPQLADLPDQKLWKANPDADYGRLNTAARGKVNIDRIKAHWPDILRIVGSIHTGTVTAYDIIRMLSHRGQPTQLGKALADYGRIFKTLHVLSYIDDEPYRREIKFLRNLQEGRHALAKHVFHGRRGELHQAYQEGMEDQLGALGLVVNALTLWNTVYLDAIIKQLRQDGHEIDDEDAMRVSPYMRKHFNVHGHYSFQQTPSQTRRPLRNVPNTTQLADP